MKTQNFYYCWLGILVVLMWTTTACTNWDSQPDSKALHIFSDFTFVGSVPYKPSEKHPVETMSLQGNEAQQLPKKLAIGTAYVFHHRGPVDDEKLALSELPSRLRAAGLQVQDAPKSPRDLMFAYIGGPFFVIKFTDGRHAGLITNPLSRDYVKQVDSGWMGEDYILVYTR
jgi:hypothetical protein